MALKIRLRQQGRTHRPFYRMVVTDAREKRDGKYKEVIGWYNPFEEETEKSVQVKSDRIQHWVNLGAVMSEKAEALIRRAAPEVIKSEQDRIQAKRTKARLKRKARAKAA